MFKKARTGNGQSTPSTPDDPLFEALGRTKKAKKRKMIRRVLSVICILTVILIVGVRMLRRQVQTQFAASSKEVLSEKAERGSISTVVSGTGMLTNVGTETVSVPSGVEVTEILVAYGDIVQEGNLLAIVDMASVRSAMSALQEEIAKLDQDITAADGDTVSSYLRAGVPGRVKILYAQADTLVEDAMVEYGGLAELSLDGYMAVDIEAPSLVSGDQVRVSLSSGKDVDGTVERVVGSTATILVTDNGPAYDEAVTVSDGDGRTLGSGRLYIHNPLKVTGYAGTIKYVNAKLNQKVYASTTLFTLKDTATTSNYDALLRQRSEKEEVLLELLRLQRYGGLPAPISGSVYSVADLDSEEEGEITDIVTLSPDVSMSVTISVDESDILALALDQKADITVKSIGDETLSGIVTEIDRTGAEGSYTAVIELDKQKGMLPGMTASVNVRIEGVDDAILIPLDALHQTSSGYYVYTSYDEETQEYGGRVEVIPGLMGSTQVEIKSGLSEGDTVYYTKKQTVTFPGGMGFGNMPGSGGMPNFGGGNSGRPNGGSMPAGFGGNSGRPNGNREGGGQP